jgi:uncharacterized membrane protein
MPYYIMALAAFVGTHFLMSHPLRAPMVKGLGANGFQIAYSLISVLTFASAILLYRDLPAQSLMWAGLGAQSAVVSAIMVLASIFLAGSFVGNPALAAPGADAAAAAAPKGVLAITRHPMMWGFALWALAHSLAHPSPKLLVLCAAMAFLALAGAAGQDRKKAIIMGAAWQGWVAKTAYWPFAAQLSGRVGWPAIWPSVPVIIAGFGIWVLASWLHPQAVGLFAAL